MSTNGIKFDGEKPDYSLVPFGALDEVVKVLTYGAKKYDRFNWEKVDAVRYQAAALRHISAYMQGEKYDPETGINHMAHAICSLLFITQFDINKKPKEVTQLSFNFDEKPVYNIDPTWYNTTYTITPRGNSIDDATPEEWNEASRAYYMNLNKGNK